MLAGLTAVLFANAALALVVCGGYVLYAQRRAALNQAMCTFCLLLAIADLSQAFQAVSPSADGCIFWYQCSWIGWSLYPAFALLVGIKLGERESWLHPWWHILLLAAPAALFLAHSQGTLLGITGFTPTPGGAWLPVITHTGWDIGYMLYQYGYDLTALAVIGVWGFTTHSVRQQRQATVVLTAAIATMLLDVLHVYLPAFSRQPALFAFEHVIFAFGLGYAVTRQRFTLPSASLAAEYITAHVRDLVLLTTRDGRIAEANPFAVQMLGWSADELRHRALMSLLVEPAALPTPAEDGAPSPPSEVQLLTRDGAPIPVELQCSPLYDRYEDIVGLVVVGRDLRPTKALQHARDHLEREVATRTAELAETNATLHRQYTFLQQVLDTIPNPVTVKDAQGHYTVCNAAFGAAVGQPITGLLGKTVHDVAPPELAAMNSASDARVIRGEALAPYETDFLAADGGIRRMLMHKAALDSGDGDYGVVVAMVDITERRAMEEASRRSEAHFRAIIDTVQDVYFHTNLDGVVEEISPSITALTGSPPERLLGRRVDTFPIDMARIPLYFATLRAQGRVDDFEFDFEHADGSFRTGAVSAHLVTDAAGVPVGIEGLIRDISARKRDEAALRASEERYRELVQNANSAIVRWRRDGAITFFNEYAEGFFGYAAEEVLGRDVRLLLPAQDSHGVDLTTLITTIAAHPEQFGSYVNEIIRRDGSRAWMAWTNKLIYDAHGTVAEVLSIGTDVTDRKRAEDALRDSERQLQERNIELQQRVDEIRTLMDVAPVAIWISPDPHCDLVIGNAAANHLYEIGEDANASANTSQVRRFYQNGGELTADALPMQQAVRENRDISDTEIDVVVPSGKRITMLGSARPVHDANGQVRGCIAVFADITDRKRAEDALRASEERFHRFFDESPIGILVLDAEGYFLDANPAALRTIGFASVADLPTGTIFDDPNVPADALTRLRAGQIARFEMTVTRDYLAQQAYTGTRRETYHVAVVGTPLLDAAQRPHQFLLQMQDVTAAKRSLEALRRSETMLAHAQQIAGMGSWEWDRDTDELHWSDEMYRIYAVDPAAYTPSIAGLRRFLAPGEYDHYADPHRFTWHPDGRWTYERDLHIVTTAGDKVLRLQSEARRDADGMPVYITGVALDITEQHQAAETIARYQQELRALALEVNLAQEAERRRLATDLHDQISQPLVLAKLKLESTRRAVADEDARAALKGISTQLDDLISLTSTLTFELSPPVLYELGLSAGVEWLAERLDTQYGIYVSMHCPHALPSMAQETRIVLFRIAQELLMNVVKHAHVTEARLTLLADADTFTLAVADAGVGITLPASAQGKAGGFGLFSIQERVRFLGGTVQIVSAPGDGTCVTVTIPLHDATVEV